MISSWNSHKILICSCPNIKASNISFSVTCLAPASTIQIASLVPATVKFNVDFSDCSTDGLITYSPSTFPTITPDTGPSNGMSEIPNANDDPSNAVITGELS